MIEVVALQKMSRLLSPGGRSRGSGGRQGPGGVAKYEYFQIYEPESDDDLGHLLDVDGKLFDRNGQYQK